MSEALLRDLDYRFGDEDLFRQALTHRSAHARHNERLEFLGDALLGMLVAEFLFHAHPTADEGQLTRARAALVNRDSLADLARGMSLGDALILGEGEQRSGGWRRDSILANALEALIGAIYLDGGMDACRRVVRRLYADRLANLDPDSAAKDAKTTLQEFLQARQLDLPRYETTRVSGPAHAQVFTVTCHVDSLAAPVTAEGRSRRRAEQAAARDALRQLKG